MISLWQFDWNHCSSFFYWFIESVGFSETRERLRCLMNSSESSLQSLLICIDKIFLLEMVDVGSRLMIFPFVHNLVSMLWIIRSYFSINKLSLRNIVVSRFISA